MTDMPRPDQAETDSPFAWVVKTGALVATATWLLVVFSFVAAQHGTGQPDGFNALGALLALLVTTPIFFIFVCRRCCSASSAASRAPRPAPRC